MNFVFCVAWRQKKEILRFALDDTAVLRATPMPKHVAQSEAKGLLTAAH